MSEISPPAGFKVEDDASGIKPPTGFSLSPDTPAKDITRAAEYNAAGQFRPVGPMPGDTDYSAPQPRNTKNDPAIFDVLPESVIKRLPSQQQVLEGVLGVMESQAGLGSAMPSAAKAVAPLAKDATAAAKAVAPLAAKAASGAGKLATDVVGNLGTQTGGESIRQAIKAGYEGGKSATAFLEALRGKSDMTGAVKLAKDAVSSMRTAKNAAYRSGMLDVSKDASVLDFKDIDKAITDAADIGTFKGQTINQEAVDTLKGIKKGIEDWKKLQPAEYHSAEGFDALKQHIGAIREATEPNTQARLVADNIYHATRDTITKQTPKYAEVMKDYHDATEQIRELEKTFSTGNKAAADTALRKLQSVMRNNVNSSYGNRLNLAEKLDDAGGGKLLPQLAGHALSSYTPRGLGQMMAGGEIVEGFEHPAFWAALPFQSPRLVGEAAHGVGAAAGKARDVLQALGVSPK